MLDERPYFSTDYGSAFLGDSLNILPKIEPKTIDLICTSPPFALLRKKSYGNVPSEEYVAWFLRFGKEFKRVLKPRGSLVIDIGGTWIKGFPIRSLYQYELLIELCKEEEKGGCGFNLAQELYWYNPAKLPTPAEWVTVRRERVKDAVNTVWWLSPSKHPKANNRRVLKEYSDSQKKLMIEGYKAKTRPSEHVISKKFRRDNKGAIPPNIVDGREAENPNNIGEAVLLPVNVISAANTSSNDPYLRACRLHGIRPHPARFPRELPEFVIGLCTTKGDVVLDPFAGSNMTGFIAEQMGRRWIAIELEQKYLIGAKFRFEYDTEAISKLEREVREANEKEQLHLDEVQA
jgi:site-specific DNA-methyltransferase (cytosine-N4-specific)